MGDRFSAVEFRGSFYASQVDGDLDGMWESTKEAETVKGELMSINLLEAALRLHDEHSEVTRNNFNSRPEREPLPEP